MAGVQRAARARQVRVVALQTLGMELVWPDEPASGPLALHRVDGWLVANDFDSAEYARRVSAHGKPFVYLSQRPAGLECCAVLPDNEKGAYRATAHLIQHGHRRIAYAGFLGQLDLRERYEGYLAAHRDASIDPDPRLLFSTENNLEIDGREIGRKLVERGLSCSAVVAGTDKTALGIISMLTESGYRVPEDVAIVGFDDIEKAQYAEPPLSTVKQRFDWLGFEGAQVLLNHLLDSAPLPEEVRVPTVFVARHSCGCNPVATLPPPPARGLGATSEVALSELLLAAAESRHLERLSVDSWPGSERIQQHLELVASGRPGLSKVELSGVWGGLLEVNRDVESVEAQVTVLEEWVRARLDDPEVDVVVAQALRLAVRQLRIELMRSWRLAEQERSRYYDFVAEANGRINQALAGAAFATAKTLNWLRWTRIRYGCLGIWEQATGSAPRQLRVIGDYGFDGRTGSIIDTRHAPADFPPLAACDLLERLGFEDVLIVVPIVGARNNRGLLMLAGPVEVELCDHVGSIGDWAALVATSLEREEVEREIRENALRDALTGLPNRALFLDRLEQVISAHRRYEQQQFAVLFIDLDDFKRINDSLGHIAGDQLIVQVAGRLQASMRETDTIARLGGDEFAIVLPNVSGDDEVMEVVARLQEALRPVFTLRGNSVFTSCSIGIAFSSTRHQSAEELLRDADTALHRAKFQGRARHEVFDSGMHDQAVQRLKLDSRLRQALDRGEFELFYQPLFSLKTGRVAGAEALIRWNHPEQGRLPPSRFLAIAEEVGLAIPISEWVLQTACREAKAWQVAGQPARYVNVNVPGLHVKTAGFVDSVRDALERSELDPTALGLELVESTLIENRRSTIETLQVLHDMGVRTAIDDFGTGYSALSYLKRFALSALKIDRGFVKGVPKDLHDSAIASAIIAMAHDLRLSVVAEGVENEMQLDFLRQHECDVVQGFLLSRPLPADECRALLVDHGKSHALLARVG